jgi:acetyl-CoA carboxylase carboxyl transferase subunit alpha
MESWLDFEKPLMELEKRIRDLKSLSKEGHPEIDEQVKRLERIAEKKREETYRNLSGWERVQLARHPLRPYTMDYISKLAPDFMELHGDRLYGDDKALIAGLGTIEGRRLFIIGQQKGRDTKENIKRNFGSPHPEGYRKALRIMHMAAKFKKPVLTLVDTPGAFPGIGAEERGQAEAIARNIYEMARLPVPILAVIIGEGGSGGALAIAVGDTVLMMEYAIYSVISPEGCAAILWGDRARAPDAAESLRLTAPDLLRLGVIDGVIPEPVGGAHRGPAEASESLKRAIVENIDRLNAGKVDEMLDRRLEKYSKMGTFLE